MVEGEVTDAFSFIFIKYFKIKDRTGEIMVITERPFPKKGERVKIRGVVEMIQIGEMTYPVIKEDSK